jgi:hypothetical protein
MTNTARHNSQLRPLSLFRTAFTTLVRRLKVLVSRSPLTKRGILLSLLACYLLLGPVASNSDIVSASLAYGLLTTIASVFILVTIGAFSLRSLALCSITPSSERSISGTETRIIFTVHPLRVPPGTWLEISLLFAHGDPPSRALRISGSSSRERKIHLDLTFPHRGAWDITAIKYSLGDITGCARYSWKAPYSDVINIYPPTVVDTSLPLLSSTQRPGDTVTDTLNRQGDPFDIKPYHPSDGIKRIVWKAFAKSGELLSRHPEASINPEGFVTIMTLARPQDDDICSKVIAYTRALEELKLDLLISCEGLHGRQLVRSSQGCEELLIDSVWDACRSTRESLEQDVNAILDWCSRPSNLITVQKMILFVSGARIANPIDAARITALATWLASRGVEPVFCVSRPALRLESERKGRLQKATSLFVTRSDSQADLPSTTDYRAFLTFCLSRDWEVFV